MEKTDSERIGILGCGWLGLPLAVSVVKSGYLVNGTTTTQEKLPNLEKAGITPFLVDLNSAGSLAGLEEFLRIDVLVISYPPRLRQGNNHFIQSISKLCQAVQNSNVRQVIFVSSTSVYPGTNGSVTEAMSLLPDSPSGIALLEAENMIRALKGKETVVLRMAGLIGYDRQPGRFFAGKKSQAHPNEVVNLIHRDDCIAIIQQVIENQVKNEIFNCCSDSHPPKVDFYTEAAVKLGLDKPEFEFSTAIHFKSVSNRKLKEKLNYQLIYPQLELFNWP